jgi:GT2 family glycosyltransferase
VKKKFWNYVKMKDSANPLVSIIIPNYNGKKHLKECLNSLEMMEFNNYEIIMVDNASSDGSVEFVKDLCPEVHVLPLEKNYGFAEGCNLGAQQARGEYIVFLNNDTKVDVFWLKELLLATKKYGENHIYSSKVLFYDQPDTLNTIGGIITPMGSGLDINFGKKDIDKYNKVRFVASPSGCSMLLKKALFLEMDGFDKDYFAYLEDVDFGWRCWLKGHKTYYIPQSVVYHKYGSTGGKMDTPFRVYNVQKNRLFNILKNFSFSKLITGFIVSVMFDLVRIFTFLVHGDFSLISSILKGNYAFIKGISPTLSKRKYIQQNRKLSDGQMQKLGLIASLSGCLKEYKRLGKLK